jgi:hypothetical protein
LFRRHPTTTTTTTTLLCLQPLDKLPYVVVDGLEGPEPVPIDRFDGGGSGVGNHSQLPEEPMFLVLGGFRGVVIGGLGRHHICILLRIARFRCERSVGGRPGNDHEPWFRKGREDREGVLLQHEREIIGRVGISVVVEEDCSAVVVVVGFVVVVWSSFDDRVVVIPRIPLEAVPVVPSLGNRVVLIDFNWSC